MGNRFDKMPPKYSISSAEIAPSDGLAIVTLYGSPSDPATLYIRFALLHKPVALNFVRSSADHHPAPTIEFGSDSVAGPREHLLRFLDARFPEPRLLRAAASEASSAPLLVAVMARLQHKSMTSHLDRVLRWVLDLETRAKAGGCRRNKDRGSSAAVDPSLGTWQMEMNKFARSYSQLLEVLLEHAQMEERLLFPILEKGHRGISKAANEEHARDLPMMNGIKEVIKSIGVLKADTPDHREAIASLVKRLSLFKEHCREHFEEEEAHLLPLLEASELKRVDDEKVVQQCVEVMEGTHSQLFHFFIEGLVPQDAMQYMDLIIKCFSPDRTASIFRTLHNKLYDVYR